MPTYPSARAFLQAVSDAYRALPAYADTGFVRALKHGAEPSCRFETAFCSPNLFRFSFERAHPYRPLGRHVTRHIVGIDGDGPYMFERTYDGQTRLGREEPLDMLVAGATGISNGAAHTIAALFFTEVGGFTLQQLRRPRFRRHRMVDGLACKQVSGLHPAGGRITAFIGCNDLMLRRLVFARPRKEQVRTIISREPIHDLQHFHAPVDA